MKLVYTVLILQLALCAVSVQAGQEMIPPDSDDGPDTQWHATMAVGAVTMDGETYQQISFRPEFPFGKFGVALDLTLYFDSDGNIREQDWDEAADYLGKIYYIRYGRKGDPLFARVGALENVTLGYGFLMKYYSNTVEYPNFKRVGAEFEWRGSGYTLEGMVGNFAEMAEPGLIGIRGTTTRAGFRFGAGYLTDGNQFAGFHDSDDDGIPDELDRFADNDDAVVFAHLKDLRDGDPVGYDQLQPLFDWPDSAALEQPLPDYRGVSQSLDAYFFDLGYPLLDDRLVLYGQFARFVDFGSGFAVPGVRVQPWPQLTISVEYRDHQDGFIPGYFGRTYEIERYSTAVVNGELVLQARSEYQLRHARAASGIYADLNTDLFNLVKIFGAYSAMKPKDGGEDNRSIFGQGSLNMNRIPKLTELTAYYQQTNVPRLFTRITESTMYGYRIGYAITGGVNLMLNYRYTYRDLNGDGEIDGDQERIKTFGIETSFRIN